MGCILIFIEFLQLLATGWNYIELNNFIEASGSFLAVIEHFHTTIWLKICMTLMVYVRMLLTFKIFSQFRKLIPMILASFKEMTSFLILLILMVVTFAIINFISPYAKG